MTYEQMVAAERERQRIVKACQEAIYRLNPQTYTQVPEESTKR